MWSKLSHQNIFSRRVMKKIFGYILIPAVLMAVTGCSTVTPLGRAAKRGDIKEVEDLLSKGANVNAVMTPGLSPFHEALFNDASLVNISSRRWNVLPERPITTNSRRN